MTRKLFVLCSCLLACAATPFSTGCGPRPGTAPDTDRTDLAAVRYQAAAEALRAGDYPRARAEVEEALRLRPGDGRALCLRGEIRLKQKDHGGAAEDFAAALQALPEAGPADLCRAHLGRGEALAALDKLAEAEAEFERAAKADPGQREAVTKARNRSIGTWHHCSTCNGTGWKSEPVLIPDDSRPPTITRVEIPNGHGGVTASYQQSGGSSGSGPRPSPTSLRQCWMCSGKGGRWVKSAE